MACTTIQIVLQLMHHLLFAGLLYCRSMGVPATLDELYATDDPDPHSKLRQLAAMEERRRAMRQLNTAASKAGHKHMPQAPQRHTAAA